MTIKHFTYKNFSAVLLVSLYVLEFSALLSAMAIYKKGDRPLSLFFANPAGFVLLVAVFTLASSAFVILFKLRNGPSPRAKWFAVHLVLSLSSVAVMLASAEVVIRIFTVGTPAGLMFANTLLIPRSWKHVAAGNRAALAKVAAQGSYLVYDNLLGWSVGRNRHSEDGLSSSSVEGIRSPRVGMTFAGAPAKRRIAIVGDSFTFGLEVRYEETWGDKLEHELGPEFQVLNFGVDGYGVDQAYLRYARDVRPWHPDIVIFGVIEGDFRRTMGVYAFLTFNAAMPFPKPRFVVGEHGLVPINLPLPTPDVIFAKHSIAELPFIEHDQSFHSFEWDWHFFFHAYAIRFLLSKYPRWSVVGPTVSDEAMRAVNGALLRLFMRLARDAGSTPIVVLFPTKTCCLPESRGRTGMRGEVLRAYGIPYLDMTDCVSTVSQAERFVIVHYSSITNAAIARCLRDSIREASQR